MKEQISISEMINMFLRKWWILALCAIILSTSAFVYAQFLVAPLYRTDGTLYVNASRTQKSDVSQSTLITSQLLANTYKEILTRRTFLSQVAADVDNRYSVYQLGKMISMDTLNETEIMEIKVVGQVPEDVYAICHSVLTHASDELVRVVNAGSVKILDDGQIPEKPFSPNVKNYTLIAFLIGIALGGAIIFAIEFLDTRVKSREDVVNRYEEPLLGEIPELVLSASANPEGGKK